MCLIVKDGCHIEIAKEDIVTFKNVLSRKNNRWESICMGTELYEYNKVLTARRFPYKSTDTIEHLQIVDQNNGIMYDHINEGFHSKVKNKCCDKICIIPKGSEICYGDDIVSLHIIVFKNRLSYLKYRLFKRNIE